MNSTYFKHYQKQTNLLAEIALSNYLISEYMMVLPLLYRSIDRYNHIRITTREIAILLEKSDSIAKNMIDELVEKGVWVRVIDNNGKTRQSRYMLNPSIMDQIPEEESQEENQVLQSIYQFYKGKELYH